MQPAVTAETCPLCPADFPALRFWTTDKPTKLGWPALAHSSHLFLCRRWRVLPLTVQTKQFPGVHINLPSSQDWRPYFSLIYTPNTNTLYVYMYVFAFVYTVGFGSGVWCFQATRQLTFFFFFAFRAESTAHGGSQARSLIRAAASCLHHSHSNMGSKPCL